MQSHKTTHIDIDAFSCVFVAERTIENGHSSEAAEEEEDIEDEEEDEVSEGEDSENSLSSSDEVGGEDSEEEDEDDEEDEEVVSMSSKDKTILTLHKRLGVLQKNFNKVQQEFDEAVKKHEQQVKAKVIAYIIACLRFLRLSDTSSLNRFICIWNISNRCFKLFSLALEYLKWCTFLKLY